MVKIYLVLLVAASILQATLRPSQAQENAEPEEAASSSASSSSSLSIPRAALEKLANLTQEDNLWILVPANASESQLHESDFSLFKLNTRALFNRPDGDGDQGDNANWARADANGPLPDEREASSSGRPRGGRKLNLFKNGLGKPQVSPLYLVNGTVCRFVNAQPICTTLSTTGLFRGLSPSLPQTQQLQQGSFVQGNNQQQQFIPINQQQPSQRQLLQSQQNIGPFGPAAAAILDDEQQTLAVAGANSTSRSQQAPRPSSVAASAPRPQSSQSPMGYAVRRPMTLLSLARPFRSG